MRGYGLSIDCDPSPVTNALRASVPPSPTRASMNTDLSVEFHGVGLALGESGVILSVPSRFEGAGDGRDEHRFFWRRSAKKNGAQWLQRVCDRQTICMRKLGDDRAEKVRFQRFLL